MANDPDLATILDLRAFRAKREQWKTKEDRPDENVVNAMARLLQRDLLMSGRIGEDDPLYWRRAARAAGKQIDRKVKTHVTDGDHFIAWIEERTPLEEERQHQKARRIIESAFQSSRSPKRSSDS